MSDILITGGTGLVGSAIKNGTKLSSKDGDLRKWETTLNIFNHHKPKKVIHCAAVVVSIFMYSTGVPVLSYILNEKNYKEFVQRT